MVSGSALTSWDHGVVSLTYRELSKIFSRSLCIAEIALGRPTCAKFQLEILTINVISSILYFSEIILARLFWRVHVSGKKTGLIKQSLTSVWSNWRRNCKQYGAPNTT